MDRSLTLRQYDARRRADRRSEESTTRMEGIWQSLAPSGLIWTGDIYWY